ncbi:MAG: hypothetical protein SGPRY_014131 [Prymnesium sp.]
MQGGCLGLGPSSSFTLSLLAELLTQMRGWIDSDRLSDPTDARMIEAALHSVSVVVISALGLMHAATRLRCPPCSLVLLGVLAFSAPISRS